jgi:AraC-like DNA-binding protein
MTSERKNEACPTVATILTPAERLRVDAAGDGTYRAIHRDAFTEVMRDVREGRASAVLLSVTRYERGDEDVGIHMVREIPRVPTVALLSQFTNTTPQALLTLGREGVRRVVDVRDPSGWRQLRACLMEDCGDEVQRRALSRLSSDLQGCAPDCWMFFEVLFSGSANISTVRRLAKGMHVLPSTLMSRFFRAGLPAPKRYLAMARLVRAAFLFENQGFSVANVANHLEYSSPQSFGRHIKTLLGISAVRFRHEHSGERMLERFHEELIAPYAVTLRGFRPLNATPQWMNGGGPSPEAKR